MIIQLTLPLQAPNKITSRVSPQELLASPEHSSLVEMNLVAGLVFDKKKNLNNRNSMATTLAEEKWLMEFLLRY